MLTLGMDRAFRNYHAEPSTMLSSLVNNVARHFQKGL